MAGRPASTAVRCTAFFTIMWPSISRAGPSPSTPTAPPPPAAPTAPKSLEVTDPPIKRRGAGFDVPSTCCHRALGGCEPLPHHAHQGGITHLKLGGGPLPPGP